MTKKWEKLYGQCMLCGARALRYFLYVSGHHAVECRGCETSWYGSNRKDVKFAAIR